MTDSGSAGKWCPRAAARLHRQASSSCCLTPTAWSASTTSSSTAEPFARGQQGVAEREALEQAAADMIIALKPGKPRLFIQVFNPGATRLRVPRQACARRTEEAAHP